MRISQENVNCRRSQSDQSPSPKRTQATLRLGFPKTLRILKRSTFQEITKSKKRFVGKSLVIQYRFAEYPRIGLTVTRKFGSAVKRNRFKRLAREAFRLLAPELPPLELVVMPKNDCTAFSLDGMIHDLKTLASQHAQSPAAKSR